MTNLRPFQRQFLRAALRADVDTAALSIPRGNGKSWLAAHILARALTPGDALHVAGAEYLLCAASLEQARLCFRFVRAALEPTGAYRFLDSNTRIGLIHKTSNTRLRVLSSNGKTAMGIVGCPLAVADEPGSWEIRGGELMADALLEAQGKPGSPLRLIFIGTLAPFAESPGHWWYDLIADGSQGSTYVQALQGDPERWDQWPEIRRVNPLANLPGADGAVLRAKLRERRAQAWRDTRLKARFLSYRLNRPTADESRVLLTAPELAGVLARPVPEREGVPVVGVDMGQSRSWSAAVACWPSGRIEARAVAPGLPDLQAQERRDRVPSGTYQRLVDDGVLTVAAGRRIPPAGLVADLLAEWGASGCICDRARVQELLDAGVAAEGRAARGKFEPSADIRAMRKMALDGDPCALAIEPESRGLVAVSLAAAVVASDKSGNRWLVKRDTNQTGRDDVAIALVAAAAKLARDGVAPKVTWGTILC